MRWLSDLVGVFLNPSSTPAAAFLRNGLMRYDSVSKRLKTYDGSVEQQYLTKTDLGRSAKTAAYTVVAADFATVIDCTANTFTVSLTASATLGAGFFVTIVNSGSGYVKVKPNGSETILTQWGLSNAVQLDPGHAVTVSCTGSVWEAIERAAPPLANPVELFTSSISAGGYYDPSDVSTLFQDTAGTTPITTTGQTVKLIKDKSGLGNDLSQSTSGNCATWQQDADGAYYLNFGSTAYYDLASAGFSCNAYTVASVNYINATSTNGNRLVDTRGTGTTGTVKGWSVFAQTAGSNSQLALADDGASHFAQVPSNSVAVYSTLAKIVQVCTYNPNTGLGNVQALSGSQQGSSITGAAPTSITTTNNSRVGAAVGAATTQNLNSRVYQLLVLGRAMPMGDVQRLWEYLARKAVYA